MSKSKKKQQTKKFPLAIFIKIFIISLFLLLLPGVVVYRQINHVQSDVIVINIPPPSPVPYPSYIGSETYPFVSAEGVLVVDLESNMTLFEKNQKVKFEPASTTKIVTALVALDYYSLDDVLTTKTVITEGRVMELVEGETMSVENLLYGLLVHSANDAAYTLAENFPGGVDAFVGEMNNKVSKLGLTDTYFTNPIGFEDENHYTTAYDLTQLSRLALKNDTIKKIIGTKSITISDNNYNIFHRLDNVNILLGTVPGVAGIKTGWTEQAKEVLTTLVKRENHEILVVLLKSNDRFGETERIINWVFNNYEWQNIKASSASAELR